MTQKELGLRCGCTRQSISSIENDRYIPLVSLALRISVALGVPVSKLFRL